MNPYSSIAFRLRCLMVDFDPENTFEIGEQARNILWDGTKRCESTTGAESIELRSLVASWSRWFEGLYEYCPGELTANLNYAAKLLESIAVDDEIELENSTPTIPPELEDEPTVEANGALEEPTLTKPKRRGKKGCDCDERYAITQQLHDHEFFTGEMPQDQFRKNKKLARNWLVRDWDKEYADGGGLWRSPLSEKSSIALCKMRDDLLQKWNSG